MHVRVALHTGLEHLDDLLAATLIHADRSQLGAVDQRRVGLSRLLSKRKRVLDQSLGHGQVFPRGGPPGMIVGDNPMQERLIELVCGRAHTLERRLGAHMLAGFERDVELQDVRPVQERGVLRRLRALRELLRHVHPKLERLRRQVGEERVDQNSG